MRVLIVDDDQFSSRILEGLLSRHGACSVAANGQEALAMFQQGHEAKSPFDLIMMDIMMPEINGLQVVQSIRENEAAMNLSLPQRVKIIMTTSLDDPRTVIKALFESDANSYLTKPVTVQKIGDELRNLKLIS